MTRAPVKISIGVFAHNEEKNILRTLASLADQDIFHKNGSDLRLRMDYCKWLH